MLKLHKICRVTNVFSVRTCSKLPSTSSKSCDPVNEVYEYQSENGNFTVRKACFKGPNIEKSEYSIKLTDNDEKSDEFKKVLEKLFKSPITFNDAPSGMKIKFISIQLEWLFYSIPGCKKIEKSFILERKIIKPGNQWLLKFLVVLTLILMIPKMFKPKKIE